MQLKDYIKVYEDVLSHDDISLIFKDIESNEWEPAKIVGMGQGEDVEDVRKTDIMPVGPNFNCSMMLFKTTDRIVGQYRETCPHMQVMINQGFDILRYTEGGHYCEHVDHNAYVPRTLSFLFYLNDDYEGGEIQFFGGQYCLKPNVGSCLVFPSNYLYPHGVTPVTSGTRYSIASWSL